MSIQNGHNPGSWRRGIDLRAFLARPALEVAPDLLGALLSANGVTVRLTEVEAYRGSDDPGSHAFRGPTPRTRVMFGEAGHLYAYFTYGMHTCANVVVGPEGEASAILFRAGEVIEGMDVARTRRRTSHRDTDLASGPARLCVALGITLADTATDLLGGGPLGLSLADVRVDNARPAAARISTSPRTGVAGPGGTADFPWRFFLDGDPTVSRYRAAVPRGRPAERRGAFDPADSLSPCQKQNPATTPGLVIT